MSTLINIVVKAREIQTLKTCSKCRRNLPLSEFYNNRGRYNGKNNYCIPCDNERSREYYQRNRLRILARMKSDQVRISANKKARMKEWRLKVLNHISDSDVKCLRCGFKDQRALQIDHITGIGKKEQAQHGNQLRYWKYILSLSISDAQSKYQILCANCNWIKRSENGEVNQHSRRNP